MNLTRVRMAAFFEELTKLAEEGRGPYKTLREAFDEKIEQRGGKTLWTGSLNSDGYPKMRDGDNIELASRVALRLAGRKVPEGMVVMHKDNNPRNLSLSNLEVGTQKENMQQMEDDGRWRPRGPNKSDEKKEAAVLYKLAAALRISM
jgi:hypothetical protein